MDDLISRDALLAAYDAAHKGPPGGARKLMVEAPAVDAVPVRRGRWIPHITEDGYKSGYDCSVCGVWLVMPDGLRKYCPDCGALMDGGETK
jgi:hypothetical protein